MIIVIYLWLTYFNTIVPSAVPAVARQALSPSAPVASDTGGPGIMGIVRGCGEFILAVGRGWREDIAGAIEKFKTI